MREAEGGGVDSGKRGWREKHHAGFKAITSEVDSLVGPTFQIYKIKSFLSSPRCNSHRHKAVHAHRRRAGPLHKVSRILKGGGRKKGFGRERQERAREEEEERGRPREVGDRWLH